MVGFYAPEEIGNQKLKYAVIVSRFEDKWLFVRHAARETWEIPGGHREAGENILDAAKRELWEETGAIDFTLSPVAVYSVTSGSRTDYGMLYYGEIAGLDPLPGCSEMAERCLMDKLPTELTYSQIQPELFRKVQGWKNTQSNTEELWDVYDRERNRTGRIHRRGDPMPKGDYHLVVHVWLLNSRGEFLLTKRSAAKGFPNMWESTGGSALAGEDSLTAALREVREETGLTLDPAWGERILSSCQEDRHRDVWLFRQDFDLRDVVLQPGETTDAMYADGNAIRALFDAGQFVPYDYLDTVLTAAV